ncbi:MAG: LysM peptidoglycan-binding domain-containing protein [Kiritimatiellae bacterium]|nr:LysM peptidoglycan-binding domain-containing protein [Verrucomicrobiota bacterium]MBU4286477.1 LysM peptidoglycan-binding domain-containing protein [Verrucomicrobiota bacterium]MBU4366136.1 LysM peptidoglycan-binding domain-containing protein [Verrucomicrobiota bacterium]MCG2660627.1 LysM peptidoglycan-binding domain-containing protein [Kiritimatiellia bacterium]
MKQYLKIIGIMAMLAGLSGCVTMQDSREVTQQQEDMLLLKEDLNRTKGKLETLEMEYQRLVRELDAMQGAANSSKGETSSTQARMDEIDRRMSVLEGARAKDRQAIVDQLSGKMADIMGNGTTAKSSRKSKTTSAAAGANTTGYEHVVKEGDTLSAIATAYKVKTSAIVEANKLKNPDTLRTGQKLFIPQP